MDIGVSTYSFQQLIGSGAITQLGCFEKAKEMGFDFIEIVDIDAYADGDLIGYAKKLKEEADRLHIKVMNIAVSADLADCDNIDAQIERLKSIIDCADILGAKSIRHDVIYRLERFKKFEDALPYLAENCCKVAEYGASKNVLVTVENHGYICQDSDRMEALYKAVNHPNFKILIDIGNFLCADEQPLSAVKKLVSYMGFLHLKDFHFLAKQETPPIGYFPTRGGNHLKGAIIGQGIVPVKECLFEIIKSGYNGGLSIEFEGGEPALEGISKGYEFLKEIFKTTF